MHFHIWFFAYDLVISGKANMEQAVLALNMILSLVY